MPNDFVERLREAAQTQPPKAPPKKRATVTKLKPSVSPDFFILDAFGDYVPAEQQHIRDASAELFILNGEEYTLWKGPRPEAKPVAVPGPGGGGLPVSVVADQFSDMRMAAAFAQMFIDEIRFWAEAGKYLVFDGRRWSTDVPGGPFPYARRMIEALYKSAFECTDYAQRGDMLKAIIKMEAHPRQETILAAARTRPELIISAVALDQHPMLITANNGVVDLKTGALQPHDAGYFMTRLIHIDYVSEAKCPVFLAFLDRIFEGNQDIIGYLQRFAGYCLTGQTGEQILLFLYGLGCNGKSVLANVLGSLMGDYASTAGSDLLMARDNRTASNDIAALRGARLVKVSEFDDGERLAESQIKTLTGGDPVTCRHLYQEYFTYTPSYKILLIGNHKPKVRGTDHGIWRRLHLLHFQVTIPEKERDPHLQDKLLGELPGILAWAVHGCLEWQRHGLNAPDEIKTATNEYRQSEDIFRQWIDDCCVKGEYIVTPASDLMESFVNFSKWRNITPQNFGRMLSDAGFTSKSSHGKRKWAGLGLAQTDDNRHWQDTGDDLDKPF